MREIEFRSWDKDEKKMYYNSQATYDCGCRGKSMICQSNFQEVIDSDDYVVEQYVGKKDKNGKKIFEGDIFTASYYPFQDEGKRNYDGVVQWFEEDCSFGFHYKLVNKEKNGISDGVCASLYDLDLSQVEVIGNIHEKEND